MVLFSCKDTEYGREFVRNKPILSNFVSENQTAMNLKSLAKDTVIYGLSSIVGRFLNYLLVPIYTYKIAAESGGYGIVNHIYGYTAFFLALLTFGMETTLFRFSNKQGENERLVYGTSLRMVAAVGIAFVAIVLALLGPISSAAGYSAHPEYLGCMAIVVALDAFQAIMFSRLRQQHRPLKFMFLKFAFIIPNVLLNLSIFFVLPKMFASHPAIQQMYVRFDYGVGLIFFVNLICTTAVTFLFAKEIKGLSYGFDKGLAKRMLKYTWPLLLLSMVGILNQVADKIMMPYLLPGHEGFVQLGIYGACAKIALIMSLLVQAFRYAYEPIIFSGTGKKDNPQALADGMKYFVIFTLLAYLAVIVYLPLLRYLVDVEYWEGLKVIPIVMLAEIFMGIYFNLSFWYKLSDQTWWGAIISAVGAAVMIAVNVIFVPSYGYMACAWGGFCGYGVSMLLSWFIGQKKYPIGYDMKSMGKYVVLAGAIFALTKLIDSADMPVAVNIVIESLLLLGFLGLVVKDFLKGRRSSCQARG